MTDFSHITDETLKEWGGLSASLLSAPSKRDLTVSERLSKTDLRWTAPASVALHGGNSPWLYWMH